MFLDRLPVESYTSLVELFVSNFHPESPFPGYFVSWPLMPFQSILFKKKSGSQVVGAKRLQLSEIPRFRCWLVNLPLPLPGKEDWVFFGVVFVPPNFPRAVSAGLCLFLRICWFSCFFF